MSWEDMMNEHFPIVGADGLFELAFVERHPSDEDLLIAVLRNIVFDEHGGQRMVRDIKEQRVPFGRQEHFALPERYAAFLRALSSVIARCPMGQLEISLPVDLVPEDTLDLLGAHDEAAFVTALEAKSRLGGLLG